VIGSTTQALGMRHPWQSIFGFFVSSKEATAFVAMYAWFFAGAIYFPIFARRTQLRMTSVESPFVLLRRCDVVKPIDRFEKQYVDPFE
jgi:hypothetical protein